MLVTTNPVEQVQDGILLVLGVTGRGVDFGPTLGSDRRRLVFDQRDLAMLDPFAADIISLGRTRNVGLGRPRGRRRDEQPRTETPDTAG